MDKKKFNQLAKKFGDVASWAMWAPVLDKPKSNVGNLSIFDDPDLYKKVNPHYAFIGLNVSGGRAPGAKIITWENFHSPCGKHHDYKLRYALKDTPYWGSYITDLIKNFPEVHSENVSAYLRQNPDVLNDNIKSFCEEMALLDNPILVAMGGKVYELLQKTVANKFQIVEIKHYSFTISKENYRAEVLERLAKIREA